MIFKENAETRQGSEATTEDAKKRTHPRGETRKMRENFLSISSAPTNRAVPANPKRQRTPGPAIPAGYQAAGNCFGGEGPANEVGGKGCFGSDIP